MPDQTPVSPAPVPPARNAAPEPAPPGMDLGPGGTIRIGEEFGTAKKNLPPAKIVLIMLGVVLVVGIYAFLNRAQPQGSGSVDNVAAAEVTGQNSTLVALTVTLRNTGQKALWIRNLGGKLEAGGKEYKDDGLAAVDFDRYFQAFPALKQGSQPALVPETKLQPGEQIKGTIIVSFPVTQQVFNQRQSVSAVIQPYDQPVPVVLTK